MIAYDNILDDVFEVYEEVLQTKIVIKDPKDWEENQRYETSVVTTFLL